MVLQQQSSVAIWGNSDKKKQNVIRDGVDLTPSEYYEHMAGCKKLPTTSQPSPELFEKFYAEAAAAGDEVVGIFLSHELSGTYQCAKLAADLANVDNVLFVDMSCSGSGAMTAAVYNLFAPGEKVLVAEAGKFGERWVEIARSRGLECTVLSAPWGQAVKAEDVAAALDADPDIRGVLIQMSETSTGVLHPVREVATSFTLRCSSRR